MMTAKAIAAAIGVSLITTAMMTAVAIIMMPEEATAVMTMVSVMPMRMMMLWTRGTWWLHYYNLWLITKKATVTAIATLG